MLEHGASRYRNYGCSAGPGGHACDVCLEGNAAKQRASRKRRAERLAADGSLVGHGTVSTYTNWGCRCDECRAAAAVVRNANGRALRRRRRREAGFGREWMMS